MDNEMRTRRNGAKQLCGHKETTCYWGYVVHNAHCSSLWTLGFWPDSVMLVHFVHIFYLATRKISSLAFCVHFPAKSVLITSLKARLINKRLCNATVKVIKQRRIVLSFNRLLSSCWFFNLLGLWVCLWNSIKVRFTS